MLPAAGGTVADVAARLHAVETDAGDRVVGGFLRALHVVAERGDAQHAATAGDHRAVLFGGAGVENLHLCLCLGVARHLGWDVRTTRLLAVGLALVGGAGILLYLWLWALVPLDPPAADEEPAVRRLVPAAAIAIGAGVVATVATFIGMASLSVGNAASDGILTWGEAAPLLVIAAGGALVAGSAVWTTSNAR